MNAVLVGVGVLPHRTPMTPRDLLAVHLHWKGSRDCRMLLLIYCDSDPGLDHTRIIKYHTLKYVRIVKKIKYAYDTRIIITQVGKNAALYIFCVMCYISKATTLHSAVA